MLPLESQVGTIARNLVLKGKHMVTRPHMQEPFCTCCPSAVLYCMSLIEGSTTEVY
jgi:hypothetical protein